MTTRNARNVSVAEVLDNNPIGGFQYRIYTLCILLVILDGFDMNSIGLVMPKIAQYLHASTSVLGLAIGAGQVGPLAGAAILGMLADRWGRKRMLVASAVIFGVFTLLTTQVASVQQFALVRFLAGIGLGGAVPNALAMACEYAPSRLRASFTTLMWSGMAIGAILGGLAGATLLPALGWQSLFWAGGIPPFFMALLVALFLPESLAFLVRQGTDKEGIRKIVGKIAPALGADREAEFYSTEQKLPGVPVKHLFSEGRTPTTVAVWVMFFCIFYLTWVLISWLPTLLRQSGATVRQTGLTFAMLNVGSLIATITIGRLMDKFNSFTTLATTFTLAFVTVGLFGYFAGSSFAVIAAMALVSGLFVFASNSGSMALATLSYPVSIRGTGLGWAYAIGKVGSIVGPIAGGFLLARHWSVGPICVVNGLSGVVGAIAVLTLKQHLAHKSTAERPKAAAASA